MMEKKPLKSMGKLKHNGNLPLATKGAPHCPPLSFISLPTVAVVENLTLMLNPTTAAAQELDFSLPEMSCGLRRKP